MSKIPIDSKEKWKYFYSKLRKTISNSEWKQSIIIRDKYKCVKCGTPTKLVHHIIKLSFIVHNVITSNPDIDPFESDDNFNTFIRFVIDKHKLEYGELICLKCHLKEDNENNIKIMKLIFIEVKCDKYEKKYNNSTQCKYYTKNCYCNYKGKYKSGLCTEIVKIKL